MLRLRGGDAMFLVCVMLDIHAREMGGRKLTYVSFQ